MKYSKRGPACGRGALTCGTVVLAGEAVLLSLYWACADPGDGVLTQPVLNYVIKIN